MNFEEPLDIDWPQFERDLNEWRDAQGEWWPMWPADLPTQRPSK
jgi:hypothetical protein